MGTIENLQRTYRGQLFVLIQVPAASPVICSVSRRPFAVTPKQDACTFPQILIYLLSCSLPNCWSLPASWMLRFAYNYVLGLA